MQDYTTHQEIIKLACTNIPTEFLRWNLRVWPNPLVVCALNILDWNPEKFSVLEKLISEVGVTDSFKIILRSSGSLEELSQSLTKKYDRLFLEMGKDLGFLGALYFNGVAIIRSHTDLMLTIKEFKEIYTCLDIRGQDVITTEHIQTTQG